MPKMHNHEWRRGFAGIRVGFFPGTRIPDFVNFTLSSPWTHGDEVRKIANELGLPVAPLPPQLEAMSLPTPATVFGSAARQLSQIAANYPNMYWTLAAGILRFEVRTDESEPLSEFDELAGRLTHEAQRVNGRIPDPEYRRIMVELARFKPILHLEGKWRDALGAWNKKHSKDGKAHHTFLSAYLDPQFKEGVRRRLNRAQAKYRKTHPDA